MMEPRYISNQVYQAMQPATLEKEPEAKSTILYANKFSGIGEVDVTDNELLSVLNSSVGTSGNNILVQLKKKMSVFRNGPWYIDSRNGLVYIHNRKFSNGSVYSYNYQAENGELLMASFRLVEVHKPMEGLSGFVNAMTKAVGMMQNQIQEVENQNNGLRVQMTNRINTNIEKPFTTWVDKTNVHDAAEADKFAGKHNYRVYKEQEKSKEARKKYNAQSPSERNKAHNELVDKSYEASDLNTMAAHMSKNSAAYALAYDHYLKCLQELGSNNPQTKAAAAEAQREASKLKVPIKDLDAHYGKYVAHLSVRLYSHGPYATVSESQKQAAIDKAVKDYIFKRPSIINHKVINVKWRENKISDKGYQGASTLIGTFDLEYFGYSKATASVRGDRVFRDIVGRYSSKSGNPMGMLQNAASNLGRKNKEKKLKATLRVVGNPILETGMQIDLQNVGNKNSGIWYIHTVSHSFEYGQGYICNIELTKQLPKNGSTGESSEVHTQSYTVDNQEANPNNSKVRKNSVGTTSSKSKANVVTGNNEYSYQDALNVPWTAAESAYVQARMATAKSDSEREKIAQEETKNIADKNYYNKIYGRNYEYAKVSGYGRDGSVNVTKSGGIGAVTSTVKSKRTSGTSVNYENAMKLSNKNRK